MQTGRLVVTAEGQASNDDRTLNGMRSFDVLSIMVHQKWHK
jgi:hypothetical protein